MHCGQWADAPVKVGKVTVMGWAVYCSLLDLKFRKHNSNVGFDFSATLYAKGVVWM